MSQITLKPLDDGQKAVEIPLGKTTIGRGQFLGCSDKKVSRNHAVLEVTSKGEVYLTPTHVNPCFYQPTAESPGQILKKDTPHKLKNGDSFSLLPRAYRYQLIIVGNAKDDKCSEQTELSQPSAKTNGSAENDSETLKENSEETIEKTVADKIPPKIEDTASKIEKNNSIEEHASKKTPPTVNDQSSPDLIENKKEVVQKESTSPKKENIPDVEEDLPEDDCEVSDRQMDAQPEHSNKENDKCSSEQPKPDAQENESAEEEEEENTSPKNSPALETENTADTKEEKKAEDCEESRDEGTLDTLPSKESVSEEESGKILSSRPEPAAKRGRKRAAAPKQPKESNINKRKTEFDTQPKPKRGRKAAAKFDFGPGEEGHSQQQVAGRTSSRTNRQTRQGLSLEDFIVSDDEEWQSDQSEPKRRRRKRGARKGGYDSGSDWEVDHKKTKKPAHKVGGSGSESGSDWGSQIKKKVGGGTRGKRKNTRTTNSDIGSDKEIDQLPSNAVKSKKDRIPCTYGKKCYRRNQNHVDQFSHPGDSDYASSGQEDDAPKNNLKLEVVQKECPYGENCFRKNAQHKKDFKHTKKVRPQREAAKQADKKTKSSRSSEEVDSYDLNDSFLNDSSDEYKAPGESGSDSDGGEKTKRFAKGGKSKRGRKV